MIPTGIVTFLFTDIEGSTGLSQQFPDSLPIALERHNEILRSTFESYNGFIFQIVGDSFCCVFQSAEDAVKAGYEAQLKITNEKWKDAVIKIRMGIHTGRAEWNGKNYLGYVTLARTQRIMSAAYGEQIIVSGNTYEYLKDFFHKGIEFRDLGERKLKDLNHPIKLYQLTASGLKSDFPPLKTLDVRPNNLPAQLTNFIGREEELNLIKNLLKESRLITLAGTGGAGKTRLALQTGAEVIDEFSGGVWYIELASLSDPARLLQVVMKTFDLKEIPDIDPYEILTGHFKDKELLIILDNCEHLIEHCASLSQNLLINCPGLKIIATSRESLCCHGEKTHRISSLNTPDPKVKVSAEKLTQFEAVRLFIERATAVRTDFRVNNDNAAALAQICYQLDGIPLAIELAAARIKVLTLEKIYERLNDRFKFLTDGMRTALPRQQTLRALIDWSYDLLSDNEKILWNRLSIFSGGWTLAAAEEICSDEIIDKYDVLDILSSLTEKSIVNFNEKKDRFSMLQTIRQYGEVKLAETDEFSKFSDKHLKYYAELTETENKKVRGFDTESALNLLEEESGNVERSLLWSVKDQNFDYGMRLTAAMSRYWQIRGYITEGISRIESVLNNFSGNKDTLYAKLICQLGNFLRLKGETDTARKYIGESMLIRRQSEDKNGIIDSAIRLALLEYDQGNYDEAIKLYEETLTLFEEIENNVGIAIILNNLGNIYSLKTDYEKAFDMYEECLKTRRLTGDKLGIAITLNNLGIVSYERGEYLKADELLEESLIIRQQVGDKNGMAITLVNLGNLNYNQGKYSEAVNAYTESKKISEEISDKGCLCDSLYGLGKTYIDIGEFDKALVNLNETLEISRMIKSKPLVAAALFGLGKISFLKNEYQQAKNYYNESAVLYLETDSKKDISVLMIRLAELEFAEKHFDNSAKLLGYIQFEYLETLKIKFPKSEQAVYDNNLKNLKEKMDTEEFKKYFYAGKAMSLKEAVELSLNH